MSELTSKEWLLMARGFSRMLWSLPLGLFSLSGALHLTALPTLRMPLYLLSLMICLWGLMALRKVPIRSAGWQRARRHGFILIALMVYLAPFVDWWRQEPQIDHLALNVLALVVVCAVLLRVICLLVAELAAYLQERVYEAEARLCGWLALLLIAAPVIGFGLYAAAQSAVYGFSIHQGWVGLLFIPHIRLIFAGMLMPVAFTFALAWKTKNLAFRQLHEDISPPQSTPPPPGD